MVLFFRPLKIGTGKLARFADGSAVVEVTKATYLILSYLFGFIVCLGLSLYIFQIFIG